MVALPEHIHNDGSTVDNYTTTSAAAFTGTSVAAASAAGGVARMKPQIIFVPNIFDNQRVHRLIHVARQSKSHWSTVTTAPPGSPYPLPVSDLLHDIQKLFSQRKLALVLSDARNSPDYF